MTVNWPAAIARAQYAICNAGIKPWPYPHVILPPAAVDAAEVLAANMPDDKAFRKLHELGRVPPGMYESRRVVTPEMAGEGGWKNAELWRDAFAAFASPDLAEMILHMFGPIIQHRLRRGANDIEADMLLVRDGNGYKIGPHTDSPRRLVSCLFYLSTTGYSWREWGTSIYIPKDRAFRCGGGPHYPFEQFDRVAAAPFAIGGGVIFAKTDNSFHGVEPIDVPPGQHRDLLLLDYRIKQ